MTELTVDLVIELQPEQVTELQTTKVVAELQTMEQVTELQKKNRAGT